MRMRLPIRNTAFEEIEYRKDHPRMIWSIFKEGYDGVDEEGYCFKAPEGVADGHYSVEVVGLVDLFGRYEHRHYYGMGVTIENGEFVPQPTMEAIFYAQAQAEASTRFDHVFIEALTYNEKRGLFEASLGS